MRTMTVHGFRQDETAGHGDAAPGAASDAAVPPEAPSATDERANTYTIVTGGVDIEDHEGKHEFLPLDDPRDPAFLRLPRLDMTDGRALRLTAFLVWSAHIRAHLASGTVFETTYRTRRPYHTAFGIAGGLLVGGGMAWVLNGAINVPRDNWREPSLIEWLFVLAGLAIAVYFMLAAFSAVARMWLSRNGSYLRVSAQGVSFTPNAPPAPFASVRDALWRPFAKVTEIETTDGRRVVVPREWGPLVRPDLILAALDDGVREQVLRRI